MQPLSKKHLDHLDSFELAFRIDTFFREDHLDSYGSRVRHQTIVTTSSVLETQSVQRLDEPARRRALLLFFRSQFQVALCQKYAGIENRLVHRQNQTDEKWNRPKIQILNAATRQAQIVAARTSFECLMEFIHFVEMGHLIPGSRSKLRTFRKWCCSPGNRFGWFVFYLLVLQRYDREHRTPEVHGTSYIAIEALCCNRWPRDDGEGYALNLAVNIWSAIVDTLNNKVPSTCSYDERDEALFARFFSWRSIDLAELWRTYGE